MQQIRFNPVTGNFDLVEVASNPLPAGGTTGQVLTKSSNTDYATQWSTPSAGGGGGFEQQFLLMGA